MQRQITDPVWAEDTYNLVERWFLGIMKDERDMIFVRTAAKITFAVFPVVIALFMSPPWLIAVLALPYIGFVMGLFGGRYGLMLHANGHRPIFKRKYRFLANYVPFVLGPLLGHTPTSFRAHHMYMHHAENNMLSDGSTTLPYQRDKFTHFLHYWSRFFFLGHAHLSWYLYTRGRTKTLRRFWYGELSWFALVGVAMYINPAAAMLVLVTPMLLMRWLMMAGNWAQHSFVDIDDPDNGFKNSTNIINSGYNHKCYNDGYHIIHHIKPAMHWSEMSKYYQDNVELFVEQDAIVLDGVSDNQHVWLLLMTKNYDKLANCLVDLKGRTHDEKVAFLKSRVHGTIGKPAGYFEFENQAQMHERDRKVSLDEALNAA